MTDIVNHSKAYTGHKRCVLVHHLLMSQQTSTGMLVLGLGNECQVLGLNGLGFGLVLGLEISRLRTISRTYKM